MRKYGIAAALAATIALAACSEEKPYSTYGQQEEAGVVPGLEVTNARMVLAPVAGNPAAIYMDIAFSGDNPIAISGATVEGAEEVMFHKPAEWDANEMVEASDVALKKGETFTFEPGGRHIMVMDPSAELKAGGTAKIVLKVAGARTHNVTAEIRAAGEER